MNSTRKGFRNPMEFVQSATEQGRAEIEAAEPAAPAEAAPLAKPAFSFPRKPPTRPVNLRMDEALFWEISDFSKLSGISFKEVVEGGARVELARLKKERGME